MEQQHRSREGGQTFVQVCEPAETKFTFPAAVVISFLVCVVMVVITASFLYTKDVRASLENQLQEHKKVSDETLKEVRDDIKKILVFMGKLEKATQ